MCCGVQPKEVTSGRRVAVSCPVPALACWTVNIKWMSTGGSYRHIALSIHIALSSDGANTLLQEVSKVRLKFNSSADYETAATLGKLQLQSTQLLEDFRSAQKQIGKPFRALSICTCVAACSQCRRC